MVRGHHVARAGGLPIGTVIALSRGGHAGPVRLSRGLVLKGACAELTVIRTTVSSTTEGVVTLVSAGGELRDLTVSDSPRPGVMLRGPGLEGRFEGVVIGGTESIAVFVGDGAHLQAEAVVVRETAGQSPSGAFGNGLRIQGGGRVELSRAVLFGNRDIGVLAHGAGTSLVGDDVTIRDTESRASDGSNGGGLVLQGEATAEMRRTLVANNRDVSVAAFSAATLSLDEVAITDTRPEVCGKATCMDEVHGHGVGSYGSGTSLRLTRFAIRDTAFCGAHVARDAILDLENGEVSHSAIGACVQVDGYDTSRLSASVRYIDNATNLQATDLPVPEHAETWLP